MNSDDFADVLIGAASYDNGQTNEGRVYLYLGSATGLGSIPYAELGGTIGGAGDVNGDGWADLLLGARTYTLNHASEGRAYLYYGQGGLP